jgi:hypothetical protein
MTEAPPRSAPDRRRTVWKAAPARLRARPTGAGGGRRRVLAGAGLALAAAVLAAAAPLAPRGPERDWGAEARAAARRSILDRAPDPGDVRFAGVRVRRTGDDDERWVCGSVAVWGGDGTLGPHRDFWVTVARVPGTRAEVREVRANGFARDDSLDRTSARFRACFARGGTE